jgi:hypothetical protein
MAGPVATCELKPPSVSFELATDADDPEIRRLLRDNPMTGQITVSLEREPGYFAEAACTQLDHQTIVARQSNRLICVGSCSFRSRFVNGRGCRVGYLGGLRLDQEAAGRFDVLRRGYTFFRELQNGNDPCFTAIASDNQRALRFLERAAPGMPIYDYVGDFVTAVLPVRRKTRAKLRRAAIERTANVDELVAFLNEHNRRYQFAPCWTAEDLRRLRGLGLQTGNFWQIRSSDRIVACGALWDQRSFKQTVVRAYAPPLSWTRRWLNPMLGVCGCPQLPPVGTALAQGFISHLAVAEDQPDLLIELVAALNRDAAVQRLDYLMLGLSEGDPRLTTLRAHFKFREYHSRLYSVRWPESENQTFKGRIANPELALL